MTVASRTFRSTPHRDAASTWAAIVALLTRGQNPTALAELQSVAGVAASIIADAAPNTSPIVVMSDGPRTRIYCVYDDEALDDASASEDALGYDPLQGDWSVSLPCNEENLDWVQKALKRHSTRISARDVADGVAVEKSASTLTSAQPLVVNPQGVFK
jgi:hypothetical protein